MVLETWGTVPYSGQTKFEIWKSTKNKKSYQHFHFFHITRENLVISWISQKFFKFIYDQWLWNFPFESSFQENKGQ